jgi:dephospho-CoA kinase
VYEAAIIIETGSFRDFERLIVVSCTEEQQVERAILRGTSGNQLTREEVLDRLHRQMPLEQKVKYADYVIDTSGTKEHTLEQTRNVYASLRSIHQP